MANIITRRGLIAGSAAMLAAQKAEAFHFGLFGPDMTATAPGGTFPRDLSLQAYSIRAPINSPVGSLAQFDVTSRAAQQLQGIGSDANTVATIHAGPGFNQPWFTGTLGDPYVTVVDVSNSSAKDFAGSAGVYIQAGATPCPPQGTATAANGTYHMSVVDRQQGLVWHGYQCQVSDATGANFSFTNSVVAGCTIQYNLGRFSDLHGNGIDAFGNTKRRNRYGWGDGVIRKWEIDRGTTIDHVLRCVMTYALLKMVNEAAWDQQQFPTFATDYCAQIPAQGATGVCAAGTQAYRGTIPFGVLMAIPSYIDISTLRDKNGKSTAAGTMLLTAAQNYGIIQRDTTGLSGTVAQFALNCEPTVDPASQTVKDMVAMMPTLAANLGICTNYAEGQWPYAGGGTPLAVCPPAFAGDI